MGDTTAEPLLNAIEARILGCLFEKQATTPDQYPLTLNAVVLACNQKTARDPLMQLEPGEVGHALRQLETRGFVKSQHASRADRYEHRLEAKLSLPRDQMAVLSLLMLRGPQTASELLARSERVAAFAGLDDVLHALERLAQRSPALAARVARQGGQREDRYVHLLCGAPEIPVATSTSFARAETVGTRASGAFDAGALEERIEQLERRVAELESRLLAVSHPLAGI